MSYLTRCEKTGERMTPAFGRLAKYRLKWRGITGTVQVSFTKSESGADVATCYYAPYTRFGLLLRNNFEFERVFISREILKQEALQHITYFAFTRRS